MTPFEEEVAADITLSLDEVKASTMHPRAKIVCMAALYSFAWFTDHFPELMKLCMKAILEKFGVTV